MDYQQARSIRKSSLLSLIAERKFEDGQGIGSSIGGAISDKFKAKATGFKESLDPLNFVRKLTGKGAVGDIAVTGLGRLFGRKDRDIQAFGGYGRKKQRGKKNPQFTSLNSGPIKPLKVGDSVADILGKMYNFMLKTDQIHKLNGEIEQAFRQEQLDEDERRHKELVKAIKGFTKNGKTAVLDKKEGEEKGGFLEPILSGLSVWAAELLANLAAFASGVAALIFTGIKPPSLPKGGKNGKAGSGSLPKESMTKGDSVAKSPKGKETPTQRRSPSKTKGGTNRETRISRNTPPSPKTSTAKKVGKFAKSALKFTNDMMLKGVNGLLKFFNNPLFKGVAIAADLSGELEQLGKDYYAHINNPNSKATNEEFEFRLEKIFAKALGGYGGLELGGLIGAAVGTTVGGPWGTIAGGLGGAYIGAELGEELGGALFQYFATGKFPEINYPQAVEYKKEHGFVIGEGGAAFGTQARGVKKRTPTVVSKPDVSSKVTPVQISPQSSLGPGEQIVVNNSTKTVAGSRQKIVSANTPDTRHSDIVRHNRNIAASV
jgi:hypothetical protein